MTKTKLVPLKAQTWLKINDNFIFWSPNHLVGGGFQEFALSPSETLARKKNREEEGIKIPLASHWYFLQTCWLQDWNESRVFGRASYISSRTITSHDVVKASPRGDPDTKFIWGSPH